MISWLHQSEEFILTSSWHKNNMFQLNIIRKLREHTPRCKTLTAAWKTHTQHKRNNLPTAHNTGTLCQNKQSQWSWQITRMLDSKRRPQTSKKSFPVCLLLSCALQLTIFQCSPNIFYPSLKQHAVLYSGKRIIIFRDNHRWITGHWS